jgi:hypothetical protein
MSAAATPESSGRSAASRFRQGSAPGAPAASSASRASRSSASGRLILQPSPLQSSTARTRPIPRDRTVQERPSIQLRRTLQLARVERGRELLHVARDALTVEPHVAPHHEQSSTPTARRAAYSAWVSECRARSSSASGQSSATSLSRLSPASPATASAASSASSRRWVAAPESGSPVESAT